jgi:hypothetical protein
MKQLLALLQQTPNRAIEIHFRSFDSFQNRGCTHYSANILVHRNSAHSTSSTTPQARADHSLSPRDVQIMLGGLRRPLSWDLLRSARLVALQRRALHVSPLRRVSDQGVRVTNAFARPSTAHPVPPQSKRTRSLTPLAPATLPEFEEDTLEDANEERAVNMVASTPPTMEELELEKARREIEVREA